MTWRLRSRQLRLAALMCIGAFLGWSTVVASDTAEQHLLATFLGAMAGLAAEMGIRAITKWRVQRAATGGFLVTLLPRANHLFGSTRREKGLPRRMTGFSRS